MAATEVGDARKIVGDLGEIVPPRRPDLLSEAWATLRQRLANDPGLRSAVRAQIVDHYSIDAMVGLTERVLAQVVMGDALD